MTDIQFVERNVFGIVKTDKSMTGIFKASGRAPFYIQHLFPDRFNFRRLDAVAVYFNHVRASAHQH